MVSTYLDIQVPRLEYSVNCKSNSMLPTTNIEAPMDLSDDRRKAQHIELLADSVPDGSLTSTQYWAQEEQKLSYIRTALHEISPSFQPGVRDNLETAKATTRSPARGPFARYILRDGEIFAEPDDGPLVKVHDLRGCIAVVDSNQYEKPRNRLWTTEHDSWITTADRNPDTPLAALDQSQWLESRLFTLDMDILEAKLKIAVKEEERMLTEGVDLFGFPRVVPARTAELKLGAKEDAPSPPSSAFKLNPTAKPFVPGAVAR
ncbi:hypothetical protein BZA05DRAFT_417868 [Tricharina praecox]|uniref:uncharacterized protein n=1 Tax=Tricharina praecox TaxID=43433 RepID=UPI00221E45BB|nr:uncharacterized protein BZA05DRAFT_417868 [Tricharina praecox]KAI5853766.1 hypothetical protein BZA05DRAFT_417868 [Tricharina praecox]